MKRRPTPFPPSSATTMPQPKPTLYIIAGCNGAGKTTFAKVFLPQEVNCLRFLNYSTHEDKSPTQSHTCKKRL